MDDMGRFVASSAKRLRGEKRTIRLDEETVDRHRRRDLAEPGRGAEGHHPGEPEGTAELEGLVLALVVSMSIVLLLLMLIRYVT